MSSSQRTTSVGNYQVEASSRDQKKIRTGVSAASNKAGSNAHEIHQLSRGSIETDTSLTLALQRFAALKLGRHPSKTSLETTGGRNGPSKADPGACGISHLIEDANHRVRFANLPTIQGSRKFAESNITHTAK